MSAVDVAREFVFEEEGGRLARCHGATLAALPSGALLAAWFAGGEEGTASTAIWLSERTASGWTAPRAVADHAGEAHWNPVLFAPPQGPVHLFYKVGARISRWRTMVTTSTDDGRTWGAARELVPGDEGGRGPVRNRPIVTGEGLWLAPASLEGRRWTCFVDRSADAGRTWRASAPIAVDPGSFPGQGVIQPALWESRAGEVHMLMRSTGGFVCRSDSADGGRTWGPVYATALANNNSGLDLARLPDGTLVLAHNPVAANWGPRTPLVLSVSRDDGASWRTVLTLEHEEVPANFDGVVPGDAGIRIDSRAEFSYPTVIPYGDGVAVAYTWRRRRIAFLEVPARIL